MFQFKAEDFISYAAGGEAHDLPSTGSSHAVCNSFGQQLGYDTVHYPEQNKRMYWHASQLADLVDIAVVSHLRLFAD